MSNKNTPPPTAPTTTYNGTTLAIFAHEALPNQAGIRIVRAHSDSWAYVAEEIIFKPAEVTEAMVVPLIKEAYEKLVVAMQEFFNVDPDKPIPEDFIDAVKYLIERDTLFTGLNLKLDNDNN